MNDYNLPKNIPPGSNVVVVDVHHAYMHLVLSLEGIIESHSVLEQTWCESVFQILEVMTQDQSGFEHMLSDLPRYEYLLAGNDIKNTAHVNQFDLAFKSAALMIRTELLSRVSIGVGFDYIPIYIHNGSIWLLKI